MSIKEIRKYYHLEKNKLDDMYVQIPNDLDRIGELLTELDKYLPDTKVTTKPDTDG